MKPVTAHITFHGKPVCECQYPASIVYGLQCEYSSISEARNVASNLKFFSKSVDPHVPLRHYAVKVVRGACQSHED